LFSWERKGIKYSIKLLPIGASVRFAGEYAEDDTPDDDPGAFFNRPKWARAIVIGTGPLLNLFSGVLAFLIMFSAFGYDIPVIAQVNQGTLAASAGLQVGDRVIKAEGKAVRTTLDYSGLQYFISEDTPIELKVRGTSGEVRTVVLQPEYVQHYRLGITISKVEGQKGVKIETVDADSNGGQPVLQAADMLLAVNGVLYEDEAFAETIENSAGQKLKVTVLRGGQTIDLEMAATEYKDALPRGIYFKVQNDFVPAIGQSFEWSWSIVKVTLRSIGMMFTGAVKPQDTLSGPVGVVTMISDVVTQQQPLADKILQLLWMFALVSISLGFMNLLPIPPLDGNHLVLIIIEAIRGKRLSVKMQSLIGIIGIALIIMLALAGLLFDVMRLMSR